MKNILFVDDDANLLNSIKRMLRRKKQEWVLFFSTSVDHALEKISQNNIDTIVCDFKMPEKGGFDLLRIIKKNDQTAAIPFILMTSLMDDNVKLDAYDMGVTDILNKPLGEGELIVRINSALKLKSYHDKILLHNQRLEEQVTERTHQILLASEISAILIQAQDLQNLLQSCTESLVKYLDAAFARIWVYDEVQNILELKASAGLYTHIVGAHQFIPVGHLKIGSIAQKREPHLTNSVVGDPRVNNQEWAKKEGMVAFAGYPLIVDDKLVGVMAMFSRNVLNDTVMDSLASVADKIALGIERKKTEAKVHMLSFYDSLTMLPNRDFFYEFIKKAISYADRYRKTLAIVLIDLDNFSRINKSLGPQRGDDCLKIVSHRLKNSLRKSDPVFNATTAASLAVRMGGDLFAVLLHDVDDVNKINQVLKRIVNSLSEVCRLDSHEVYLSASIGIARFPDDGKDVDILLKNTETALDYAKQKKGTVFEFYSDIMNKTSIEYLDLEASLHKAIKSKEFKLYYQPKIDLKTDNIIGVEALIRWHQKDGTIVSPGDFIPLAESTGLIVPMGSFVLEEACRQAKEWQDMGLPLFSIAVNVSGIQFGQKDFVKTVLNAINTSKLDPEVIEIEITETAIMLNPKKAISYLHELKEMGVLISLDDFGTGYSSLSYLQKLPLDSLKINMSFITNVVNNVNDAMIVKAIIAMAHHLNLKVVAEGVEDEKQLAFLRAIDCDQVQGYYYSPPTPAENICKLVKQLSE
ncbi:two-component system response regulator [Desulfogranum japonicum]|uniref:two-component system response regulator n=1 Tax=Desulfogranum japonicum TaxID=231447 RepID=UPI0003F4BC73|nr:EAL domain-containing protein [Desulfogranum japonicum]